MDPNQPYAQVLAEYQGGAEQVFYTYGDDLLSQTRAGAPSYYHYDALGSTRALTDAAGSLTDAYAYKAFGEIAAQRGATPNAYLFAGEAFDAGLKQYYLRARYMDPAAGRFTAPDPWPGSLDVPLSLHKYLYVHLEPSGATDPSGLSYSSTLQDLQAISIALARTVSVRMLKKIVRKAVNSAVKNGVNAKRKAKQCVMSKGRKCDIDIPVLIVGGDRPQMADHISAAQMGGGTNYFPSGFLFSFEDRKGDREWYIGKKGCTDKDKNEAKAKNAGQEVECDEFPMWSTHKGGPKHHPLYVSLRYVSARQNGSIGAMWGALARDAGMKVDKNIQALIIAWREIPLSMGLPLNKM